MFTALTLLFATATTVLGHGYVEQVVTSSGTYSGYLPYQDPYMSPAPERIIRKIPGNGPVEDVASIDIQCNGWSAGNVTGSSPAAAVAVAAAGTNVALTWTTWPDSHMGPIITYMARAPSDVTAWSPGSDAVWFKVDEQGYVDGKWAATDILTGENNSVYTFKIPETLKAGQYIIRHEIIALHAAYAYPGAQFYPSCIQVEVTGSGTETGPSELVAFPGAYTADTPGIVFDAYKTGVEYPIPGPTVWTGGSGSSTPATSTAAAAGTSKVVASSSTAAASSSTAVASTSTAAANTSTAATGTSATAAPVTTSAAPVATSTSATPATTAAAVGGTAARYAQCGGRTYTGPTTCVSGSTCNFMNEYYSQCV